MLQWSDNAAADYLLNRLGEAPFRVTLREAGLVDQNRPQSIAGLFLTWANHERPDPSWFDVWRLVFMNRKRYFSAATKLAARYAGDVDWRSAELAWTATAPRLAFDRMAVLANQLYPRGTARGYARIMAHVMTDTFISAAVSLIMRRQLDWPLRYIAAPFASWGHKGGSLPGVVTDVNFFVPIEGPFFGQRRVAVTFLRNLPEWASQELGRTLGSNLFDRALALDPTFVERVAAVIRE